MRHKILYIIVILTSVTAFGMKAVTVDDVLDSIAANNLQLKAAEAKKNSNIADIKSSNNLGDTELEFEYQKGDNIDGNKYGFSISQGFEWPGTYIARSKSNKSKIKASEYEFLSQKLEIMTNAGQLCLSIINANRKIKLRTEIYNNIKQLADEYDKGFRHGEISILDINKLKIELLNVKHDLDLSVTERNALIDELTAINGNKAIAGVENLENYPEQELKAFDTYTSEIVAYDPVINFNRETIESAAKETSVAKMGWLPKFSIGYKFANELGDKFNGVSVGMALPVFANRNKVAKAEAEKISTEYSNHDAVAVKASEVKSQYAQAVYLKSQICSYSSILSDSSNKQMLKKALDGGQITLLNYLLELRYFLDARQTLLDLEFEYNSVLSSLNKYQLL